jgi:hypothetical protein
MIPGLKSQSYPYFISTRSPVQLDWFIKGRMVCGLPGIPIHAPKRPWDPSKRVRALFGPGLKPDSLGMAPNLSNMHNAQRANADPSKRVVLLTKLISFSVDMHHGKLRQIGPALKDLT